MISIFVTTEGRVSSTKLFLSYHNTTNIFKNGNPMKKYKIR